ncbi:hypothetical protein D0867_12129 [Hortaea werneckii]|uniref:Uncharacterized protein n=1 Tax=Hortaea werneckii TaxID=91943 RepID=A0A3M6Y8J3_HORWE|nr:hypothetical protein D0867_12129 [Hortaea werneckii]
MDTTTSINTSTPNMSSSAGAKVTKDPSTFQDPKNEGPGVVTSDSLAGQSVKEGGSFAANSDARGPMGQPSSSTTTNTTDTSGATILGAAPTAEAREASDGWNESAQLNAGRNLGSGAGPTYSTQASGGAGGAGLPPPGSGQGAAAPGYASHPAPSMGDNFLPKGQNLQEGGFSSDDPNASYTSEIGGQNDPGRAALGAFEARDVPVSGGAGARGQNVSGEGQFNNLDETSA